MAGKRAEKLNIWVTSVEMMCVVTMMWASLHSALSNCGTAAIQSVQETAGNNLTIPTEAPRKHTTASAWERNVGRPRCLGRSSILERQADREMQVHFCWVSSSTSEQWPKGSTHPLLSSLKRKKAGGVLELQLMSHLPLTLVNFSPRQGISDPRRANKTPGNYTGVSTTRALLSSGPFYFAGANV